MTYKHPIKEITIILLIIAIDQISKYIMIENLSDTRFQTVINGFFDLVLVANSGVSFGIGNELSPIFWIIIAIAIIVLLLYWMVKEQNYWQRIGFAFAIGGGVGNIIDRIWHGAVVDFLYFHYHNQYSFPAFNIADIMITSGAVILIYFIIFKSESHDRA